MTITMTAWKRPDYTRQVIRALESCDESDDVQLYAYVEPGNDEVQAILTGSRLLKDLTVNPSVFGIPRNTHQALARGFSHSDYVVHIEDDTLPAKDFLRYHKWASQHFRDDNGVFSVTGYHKAVEWPSEEHYHAVGRKPWFTCWGWGTWADRWAEIDKYWSNANKGFAWHVNLGIRLNRVEIFPWLSRVQNIGDLGGVHRDGYNDDKVDVWAGKVDFEYRRFSER